MKHFSLMLLLWGVLFTACNDDVTPELTVIKEYTLTVVDKADVPVTKATVNVYMSHKPDFLVMNKTTDIFGKVHFLNLKPGNYMVTAMIGENEVAKSNILVNTDNSLNLSTLKANNYAVKTSDYKIIVQSDRGAAIAERKVDLVTKDGGIIYKSGLTDTNGELVFAKVPLDKYLVKVYDETNDNYLLTEEIEVVEDIAKNESNVEIVKLVHNSDIVITGMMVDPKGTNDPAIGSVSGGGFTHPGGYQYIQLLALKDIDFGETPYCVVTGNNATSPTDKTYPAALKGWIQSKGQNNKTTYQMNLTEGSVKMGEFFYVGGLSYMIAGYYNDWGSPMVEKSRWWAFDYRNKRGSEDNGASKGGSGIFNTLNSDKKTNVPDGIAVFKGTQIDENTIPQDVVFYGGDSPIREEDRYQIADNDHYRRVSSKGTEQFFFGAGTNSWFAKQGYHDDGCYIMMGGEVTPTEWLKPRTGATYKLNVQNGPESVSLADIESREGVTVFVNK